MSEKIAIQETGSVAGTEIVVSNVNKIPLPVRGCDSQDKL